MRVTGVKVSCSLNCLMQAIYIVMVTFDVLRKVVAPNVLTQVCVDEEVCEWE